METERGIVTWLKNPDRLVSVDEILPNWAAQTISVSIDRPQQHAAPIELLGRIRRAWGTRLKRSASPEGFAGEPCPWDPPCARDIFFNEQFRFSPSHGLPKPYVFSMDVERHRLDIRLTLFGAGIDYAYAAREALVEALRSGVSWEEHERPVDHSVANAEILTCRMAPQLPDEISPDCTRLRISFLTPLKLRGADPADQPSTLVARMARRTENMLRWMGCGLEAEWAHYSQAWKALDYHIADEGRELVQQTSRRQRKSYEVEATRLTLEVEGNLAPLIPFLACAQTCNVGGMADAGFGRFRLQQGRD
ncbi:MAG: hypothetical protein R3D34_15945 [Nitratireductor sp.]